MTIATAVAGLKTIIDAVANVRPASNTPESQSTSLASVVYPGAAVWTQDTIAHPLESQTLTLVAEVGKVRSDLQRDVAAMMPFYDSIRDAIAADQTLGGTVLGISSLRMALVGPGGSAFFDIAVQVTVEAFLYDL